MIQVTSELLSKYVHTNYRFDGYKTAKRIADKLRFHFDGLDKDDDNTYKQNPVFQELIYERRPSESPHIQEYRYKIYLNHTEVPCFKVLNSLQKIVKSPDWSISYANSLKPSKIIESESLETYCEQEFPFFGSVENWLYSFGMKEILCDPNGLVCVLPLEYMVELNEYIKPYPYFVRSEDVYEFKPDELAIFKTSKTYEFMGNNGVIYKDCIVAIITKTEIWEAYKFNEKNEWRLELKYIHNIGKLPAWRAGGVFKEIINNAPIYKSFVSPMLSGLDAAARELSDLDAEVVQHIFSTMWYYASQDCKTCNGLGKISKEGKSSVCGSCDGNGRIAKSPYKDFVVTPPTMGESHSVPTPPAGYIEKNVEIVKVQDERIKNHIYNALASLNMEFLAAVPLNQSGKAKEVDKSELNNFVYKVAYHLVENIIKPIYFFINEYRYMIVIPNPEQRKQMLPRIAVPDRFDILSEAYLGDQVTQAKLGNHSYIIVDNLEIEYIQKKFENDPELRDKIITIKQLDPFSSLSVTEKSDLMLTGSVLKEDIVLSVYIKYFVERAISEHKDFLNMEYLDKLDIVLGYAKEKVNESTKAIKDLMGDEMTGIGAVGEDTPKDIEAEAAAKLKGSVGGAQVITGFVEKVSQGLMNYQAAVESLKFLFKVDDAQARLLLGPESAIKKEDDRRITSGAGPGNQGVQ